MFLFETERLGLRLLEPSNLEDIMTFWGDEEVMGFCGGPGTRERELRAIGYYAELQQRRGLSVYGVFEKKYKHMIGACGFNPGETEEEAELIYHFAKAYWGKGYATEAAKACISYARGVQSIERIVASTDPRNVVSGKVLEKLGFQYEGMKWHEDLQQEEPTYVMRLR
ncbi:GNAT family N-acetyltransferase [Acidaminobacter sp.]|uniref:GNAT family N-acetyltransferase n=1 Tax=Acidaminobacter sp. TaxID=1872102 RepID=UPI002566C7EA|nr:GNAT family N-acetyltransferase [Acidaminobacter sp.]MDK9711050.1 GNAT family N-acetyltransferase [Acidaminobacter sp.]